MGSSSSTMYSSQQRRSELDQVESSTMSKGIPKGRQSVSSNMTLKSPVKVVETTSQIRAVEKEEKEKEGNERNIKEASKTQEGSSQPRAGLFCDEEQNLNAQAEKQERSPGVCTDSAKLEELLKGMALPNHDMQSCLKIVEEHSQLICYLKTAAETTSDLLGPSDDVCLNNLQNLNIEFFEVESNDRNIVGDFLSCTQFCKNSFVKYKDILKTAGLEYFNDTVLQDIRSISVEAQQILDLIRGHWWNYSDASINFGAQLSKNGILQEITQDVSNLIGMEGRKLRHSYTFESGFGILHNLAKLPSLRQTYRDLNVVNILANFLDYEDETKVTMVVLMTLALIIDENQTHLLFSHDSVFENMLQITNLAWKQQDHRYYGFSMEELLLALTGLSKNDKVKKILVQKGVLTKVLEVLMGGDDKEKEQAAKLLWELSFDADNKKIIEADEALMVVVKQLSTHNNRKIARASQGALWMIGMRTDEDKKKKKRKSEKSPRQKKKTTGHVMISYNWSDQKKIIEIRDELVSRGYKIWMDIDNISGSTLQAMAEAVEQAEVVLVCMSEKYKESANCRSEAEYAFSLQKPIIPLLMQFDYKPDGWLGILLGTKIFFNFSGKYPFATKMEELIKETGDRGKLSQDSVDGPIVKDEAAPVGSAPGHNPTTPFNTLDWISENKLAKFTCLHSLSQEQLQFLKKISSRAPEFYYSFVLDLLSGKITTENLTELIMVTNAIEKIPK